MRIMRKMLAMFSVVGVMSGLFGVSQVQAIDGKNYPGSMCGLHYGNTSTTSGGAIGNWSTTAWLYVDCPVVKDSIDYSISSGFVRVTDRNPTAYADVSCALNSLYQGGSSFSGWWSAYKYSAGSSTAVQTLSFPGLSANANAHYYYSCAIPPAYGTAVSYIDTYRVNENE